MHISRLKKVEVLRLGRSIRRARKLWSFSDADLAAACGLDKDYFSKIERGGQDMLFSELCEICEVLRCDIAAVTKGIPHLPPRSSHAPPLSMLEVFHKSPSGFGRLIWMCCNFVVKPKTGVDDQKFSSSQRTDRE